MNFFLYLLFFTTGTNFHSFHFLTFYFEVIIDEQEGPKNPRPSFPPEILSYIGIVQYPNPKNDIGTIHRPSDRKDFLK